MSDQEPISPESATAKLASTASPQAQALSLFINSAIEQLHASTETTRSDCGLLFLGNWQDAFPRLLVTDPVLEPVDKLTWQVIRIHVATPGAVTAFPSYETIATYTNVRSNHTVSRALAILRATRWLSLCARVRNSKGRYLGNVYVLHDEPITLGDAMHLDSEYMHFLISSGDHKHPRVRKIAQSVLATIQELINSNRDPLGERIHTRAYERRLSTLTRKHSHIEPSLVLAERRDIYAISDIHIARLETAEAVGLKNLHTVTDEKNGPVQNMHTDDSPISGHVQNLYAEQNDKNSALKNMHSVQKVHTATCSSSKYINTTTTSNNTYRAREENNRELHFPASLTQNEQDLAQMYLYRIDAAMRQDVLDEWHGRLLAAERHSNPIDNPIGYLAGLCRRAGTGEFQITIGLKIRDQRESEARRAREQQWRDEQDRQRLAEQQECASQNQEAKTPLELRIQKIRESTATKGRKGDDE